MNLVKLDKDGDSITLTLPASVVEALHIRENDEFILEVAGDRLILSRVGQDFQDAWEAYQEIEPRYQNTHRRLAE